MQAELLKAITPIAFAGTAIGILIAPTANAAPTQCRTPTAGTTICQRPGGSTSINSSPTQTGPYLPYDCYLDYLDPLCDDGNSISIGGPGFFPRPSPH
jgi:hypothetical protein